MDLTQIPLPEQLRPTLETVETISTFWLAVPTFDAMSYNQLSVAFLTYLYNNGLKVVKLEDMDLQ
jgi:hypothetical protein